MAEGQMLVDLKSKRDASISGFSRFGALPRTDSGLQGFVSDVGRASHRLFLAKEETSRHHFSRNFRGHW